MLTSMSQLFPGKDTGKHFDVTSLTSLDEAIMPMYRAFEVGEVHLENLTLTSLDPHYFPLSEV